MGVAEELSIDSDALVGSICSTRHVAPLQLYIQNLEILN